MRPTPGNARFRGDVPVILWGSDLGFYDTSLVARLGGTGCESSVWRSDSSMMCVMSHGWKGWSSSQPLAITAGTGVFTSRAPFYFDELQLRTVGERVPVTFLLDFVGVTPNLTPIQEYSVLHLLREFLVHGSVDDLVVLSSFSSSNRRRNLKEPGPEGPELQVRLGGWLGTTDVDGSLYSHEDESKGRQLLQEAQSEAASATFLVVFWVADQDKMENMRKVYDDVQSSESKILAAAQRRFLPVTILLIPEPISYYDKGGQRVSCCCDAEVCPCSICFKPSNGASTVMFIFVLVLGCLMLGFCLLYFAWLRQFAGRATVYAHQALDSFEAGIPGRSVSVRGIDAIVLERRMAWADQNLDEDWRERSPGRIASHLSNDLTLNDAEDSRGSRSLHSLSGRSHRSLAVGIEARMPLYQPLGLPSGVAPSASGTRNSHSDLPTRFTSTSRDLGASPLQRIAETGPALPKQDEGLGHAPTHWQAGTMPTAPLPRSWMPSQESMSVPTGAPHSGLPQFSSPAVILPQPIEIESMTQPQGVLAETQVSEPPEINDSESAEPVRELPRLQGQFRLFGQQM